MADKKRKNLASGPGDDLKKVLQAVEDTLRTGSVPEGPVLSVDEETQKKLSEILTEIVATQQFALAIAQGDLSQELAVQGQMAGSLKTLQSNLRHLTWQAGQIAGGDFSQRIHFMGDFSDSFNTMVEHLSKDKTNRIQREEQLRKFNATLTDEIAKYRKTEESLRESRQILEAVLNSITARVFWKDKNLVYLGCNAPFARDAGFEKPQDLIGKDDYAMGWREQAELYRKDDRVVIESGKPKLLFEEPETTPSGKEIYVLTSKVPLRNAEDEIVGVLGTYLDITERKKAEEEERLTRERFETLLKVSAMQDASETELSQYVMEAACRMTGSTLAFIGRMTPDESIMDVVAWSESTMADCKVAVSPLHFPIEKAGIWADAVRTRKTKIVNDYSAPHPGKKGLPKGHVGITRFLSLPILENGMVVMVAAVANKTHDYDEADVTRLTLLMQGVWGNLQRRKVEEALRRQAEIIDQTHDSIITTDLEGRVTSWNNGAERLYGYTAEESLGRDVAFIYPENEQEVLKSQYLPPLKKKGSHEIEARMQKKSGEYFCVHLSLSLLKDETGTAFGMIGYSMDITERKQAEEAIQTTVKLNQLIDTMSVSDSMIYTLDEAERLTDSRIGFFHLVNPDEKTIQLSAWSTETSKHCYIPSEPERHYPVAKAGVWVDCLRERKPIIHNDYASLSHKKGLPEGHVPVTREIVVPIFEEDRIVAIIGVGNKTTDYYEKDSNVLALLAKNVWTLIQRKQTEEALHESEYRFRELFNSMSSGVAVYRAVDDGNDFKFVDFNHGAELIENTKKQEVIGKRVSEAFPGVEEFGLMEVFRRVWRTGNSEHHPISLYRDEQISSWRENYVYRLPSMEIVAIYEDVTNRKQAEEALKQNENMYRTLFEESPISLWEEDFSDVKNWIDANTKNGTNEIDTYLREHQEEIRACASLVKVVKINHATISLFGAASAREFYDGLSVIFPDESLDSFCEEIVALFHGETEFETEIPLRTLQGETKVVIMKVTVVPGYERTLSKIFVSVIDITQRKNVEVSLREANNKLNMLSSITRHDILNQIMVIRSYLELSEDIVDDPKLREYMKYEDNAADTIQRQIEFTRYYQDIGVEEPIWLDPGEIVAKVAKQLDLKGIAMDNSLSGMEIFADPLIAKVFYNLIENSLRHGKHVTAIGFSYSKKENLLVITYRDNGVGIAEEEKKKLFKKGFGKHTGLGLFLSREILSITGMSIEENGKQGEGVNFDIVVPKNGFRKTA